MQKDLEQWKNPAELSDSERWIIMMGIGYFSAAEGIVGDNIQHVVRELSPHLNSNSFLAVMLTRKISMQTVCCT
jgi:ribonucleotide reductase beta subunit family protein with ferritin-like domain